MSVMAGLILTLSTTAPVALADFGTLAPPGRSVDSPSVRFTRDSQKPHRSRYLLPMVDTFDTDKTPPRLRIRGRKVKLRVPLGRGI